MMSKNSAVKVAKLPFPGLLPVTDVLHLLQTDLLLGVDLGVMLGTAAHVSTDTD